MARFISLLLAIAATLGLLFLPAMRGGELTPMEHGLLSPLMLAICGSFAHGLGYIPRNPVLRGVLHPGVLWPSIGVLGAVWIAESWVG